MSKKAATFRGDFSATGATASLVPANAYGVKGTATGSLINYGVYGLAALAPAATTIHFGVYGDLGPVCGGCPTTPNFAGFFVGDVGNTGLMYFASDSTLKQNIQSIQNPIAIVSQLNPKSYDFKRQQYESMQLPEGTHFGLISQEVETVLPQLVKNTVLPARYDSLGNQIFSEVDYKALNYIELIPLLIAAIKEQQQSLLTMQAQLNNCCNAGNRNANPNNQGANSSIDVELKNSKSIILDQNVPNPFAEQTTITYFITDNVNKAQIFFYDQKGTILKIVDIHEKGAGEINVFAADLSSGTYTYSLIADGKLIETKKMVKQN